MACMRHLSSNPWGPTLTTIFIMGWGGGGGGQALPEKPVQNLEMGVSRLASYSVGRVIVGSDVKCHN